MGKTPFKGDYDQAGIYSILNEEPEDLSEIEPELQQIISKALAKNPDVRYQTASEISGELHAIGEGRKVNRKTKRSKLT